jgi:Tfp pilus assembly protein PilE
MRTALPRRCGFTVLELVITFGVICLLLMILVPAVGSAHRVALRSHCQNNLKQLGLALLSYHETFDTFPPGYVSRGVSSTDSSELETGPGYAWGSLLLDFLDQRALATGIDFDLDATDPANTSAMAVAMPLFVCPANQTPQAFDVTVGLTTYILGSSNYVGMYGVGDLTMLPGRPDGPGVFYRNSCTSSFRIRDGVSNTILVAERATRHDFDPRDQAGVAANSGWFAALAGAERPAGVLDAPMMRSGSASLVLGTVGLRERGFGLLRPNHTNHIASFSSPHEAGLHALFGDASVHFLHDDLEQQTLRDLAQHSDGGIQSEF